MRIISQSGRFDIPYEMAVVYVEYESVIAKVGDERYVMGKYLTKEKAVKSMQMLREKYLLYKSATNEKSFYEFFDNHKVFQFPQDEDVEINNGLE